MRKIGWIAALALLSTTPILAQMVGQVGNNVGQSPAEARQVDQKFQELQQEGKLKSAKSDPANELKIGSDLVKQSKFADAIPHLDAALEKRPNDVTTLIYLGFSHRMLAHDMAGVAKTDQYLSALEYYKRGLALAPDNRLLHEYTGKVRLLLGDLPAAQAELKTLHQLCPSGCDELRALSAAVPEPAN